MLEHAYWIALLPFVSSLLVLFFGKESERSPWPYLGLAAMFAAFLHACGVFHWVATHPESLPFYVTWPWLSFGEYSISAGMLIDGPAAVMLVVVTLVSFLVQLYSLAYMHGDARFKRYYAYLSFFTASMLGLVLSSNLLILFACWELVGVSSYLLIGFWFEKPGPAYASKKAFITTKLGDMGFYIGLLLLFAHAGTFDLVMLQERAALGPQYFPAGLACAVGLLFLCGAAGKSAQWPLFIWLPDAMEGPTPVSALIHAATMVAAGIYLVARTYFIYALSPIAMEAVAWTGLLTAFLAATMALTATDIKRVLAFSTVSQLGYMLLGLGVGGYTSGLFHLTTHAFFKALLFLGAGSVIHAVHDNDMRRMGGLAGKMPNTFLTMAIATLAIAGFPGLSGWFSKEAILHDVWAHNPGMWAIACLTAALTSFYMFRLLFMTFLGKPRDAHAFEHAHESPAVMTVPLWILAVLSLQAGFLLEHRGFFASLIHFGEGHGAAHPAPGWLPWAAIGAFAAGLGLSWRFYGTGDFSRAESVRARFSSLAAVLRERYGMDAFFLWWVRLSDRAAAALFWIDDKIVDGIFVDGWGLVTRTLAEVQGFFDDFFVDGAVDGVAHVTRDAGWGLRQLVRGQVQEYLMYVALAVSLLATFLLTR